MTCIKVAAIREKIKYCTFNGLSVVVIIWIRDTRFFSAMIQLLRNPLAACIGIPHSRKKAYGDLSQD